jgi:hypothetical protein
MADPDTPKEPWHLKKEINVGVIVAVVAYGVLAVWYASDFNSWRHQVEDHLARLDKASAESGTRADRTDHELTDRLGRIETILTEIERRLDKGDK